jgi:hypothetical protein
VKGTCSGFSYANDRESPLQSVDAISTRTRSVEIFAIFLIAAGASTALFGFFRLDSCLFSQGNLF